MSSSHPQEKYHKRYKDNGQFTDHLWSLVYPSMVGFKPLGGIQNKTVGSESCWRLAFGGTPSLHCQVTMSNLR